MTGQTLDTRSDHHWPKKRQIFKLIVFIAAASVFLLGVYTGGFKGENVHIQLSPAEKSTDKQDRSQPLIKQRLNTSRNQSSKLQTAVEDFNKDTGQLRILCLIMTMAKDVRTKVRAVNQTWARRCHIHYYVINTRVKRHDFLNIDIADDRRLLIEKMKRAFRFVYDNHLNDFDYILKADDDTYVIIENLQLLMSNYPSYEPGYLGFHFDKFVKAGYMSGGAGYVITNRGLRHLVERGYDKQLCPVINRPDDKENSEDIETGRCLEFAGVPPLSSIDSDGRETFHPYTLHQHLFNGLPTYLFSWAKNKLRRGKGCCSRYSISFHYMTPDAMMYTHHLLYDTTVFGVTARAQNPKDIFKIGKV